MKDKKAIIKKREEIRGAVARGWCTKRNSNKVIDVELAEDITKEIEKLMSDYAEYVSRQLKVIEPPEDVENLTDKRQAFMIGQMNTMVQLKKIIDSEQRERARK